ncbi:MAG: GNAT family N-acetyltransferase [Pseudomonadota bacterium]
MAGLKQTSLFRIEAEEHDLDAALEARGYLLVDPVACLVGATDGLQPPHRDRVLYCDAPLATHVELWEQAGIGPARRAVMERVRGAKCHLLGRSGDRPAGTGFVAVAGPIAFLHALEVAQWARREGLGTDLTLGAAVFARRAGASHLAVLVERANTPAVALYSRLGLVEAGGYHYRVHP